jgi:hypothetical protein
MNEQTVSMMPYLASAIEGVLLQVAETDYARAKQALHEEETAQLQGE